MQQEKKQLYEIQERGLTEVLSILNEDNPTIGVAPTGYGKRLVVCTAANRFIQKNPERYCIMFVHMKELLDGARKDLFNEFGIISQKIDAQTKNIDQNARVFVAMAQTFKRRALNEQFLENFKDKKILIIIDEVHRGEFFNLLKYFPKSILFGVTATPKSAQKKKPLKSMWKHCVIMATTEQTLELNQLHPDRGIVPCLGYAPKSLIDTSSLKMKGDDYDEDDMGEKGSKTEQIKAVLDYYYQFCYGKKTVIFNSNIKHNIKVYEAFKEAGLNVRCLDSKDFGGDKYRDELFKWLHREHDAILCNVSIATTGFDEKTIQWIIINRKTKLLELIVQMIGRGARACKFDDGTFKEFYGLIDIWNNIKDIGFNPNKNIDWLNRFNNPDKPSEGISPIKLCPQCGAINSASTRICLAKIYIPLLDIEGGECGYIFPVEEAVEDLIPKEMVRLFQDEISVQHAIEVFKDRHEYLAYDNILNGICILSKKEMGLNLVDGTVDLEMVQLEFIFETAYNKSKEWFKARGKRPYMNFRHGVMDEMIKRLVKNGFSLDLEMVNAIKNQYKRHGDPVTIDIN